MHEDADTIAAIATAPHVAAGIGIIRISGNNLSTFSNQIAGISPTPRQAHYVDFKDAQGQLIDQGILLYFPAPHSFTGEDVLELQGHGGCAVMQLLLKHCYALGARPAKPGEFSQRAFLNQKIDLLQAEGICDLISAQSERAVHSAMRSLNGAFSQHVQAIQVQLTRVRTYLEAHIDFPEEEIDSTGLEQTAIKIQNIVTQIETLLKQCHHSDLIRSGLNLSIVGAPNVGKSSMLNYLCQQNRAIVSPIPGTTRDSIEERINIAGNLINLIDTAGIRHSDDNIEQMGIERSLAHLEYSDIVLLMFDYHEHTSFSPLLFEALHTLASHTQLCIVGNKMDLVTQCLSTELLQQQIHQLQQQYHCSEIIQISLKAQLNLSQLHSTLAQAVSNTLSQETEYLARDRHINALELSLTHLSQAQHQVASLELCAEEMRLAQTHLSKITGEFSSDDLLGEIFSTFCIGK